MAVPAQPSATIILLRDGSVGVELLLLRRAKQLKVHAGAWVFPGGRVESDDGQGEGADPLVAARAAAVRELAEEAGIELTEVALVPMSRWTTPDFMPRRFETWFFVAEIGQVEVLVDGGEIDDYRWLSPDTAISERQAGQLELPPPTFVTITELAGYSSARQAVVATAGRPPRIYTPRLCQVEGGACSLYEGDAGYESNDPARSGSRHRLWILDSGWRYERSDD